MNKYVNEGDFFMVMSTANICILIAIIAYLAFVVGIGIYYSRKNIKY